MDPKCRLKARWTGDRGHKAVRCRRRRLFDGNHFVGGEFCLKLIGYHLGNLALDGKNIREVAVIGLTPEMRVVAGIDQLRIHSHMIRDTLHASFQYICDAELLADLAQIALHAVFLYCITLVRLITFRSAILARSVRISSWTPSAK